MSSRLWAVQPLTILLFGCGGLEVEVSADPTELLANGTSSARITIRSTAGDGADVEVTTDRGRFNPDATSPTQDLSLSLSSGTVTTELYSDSVPGEATVTATVYADNGETRSASIRVRFRQQQPASNAIALRCALVNVGALREPALEVAVPCLLDARDVTATPIDVTSLEVGFLTEAGSVDPSTAFDADGNRAFVYRATGSGPRGTYPLAGEPSRADDAGGAERNPRDGLCTIVAYVSHAAEGFVDLDGDGVYSPEAGETFDDIGEPLLDVDDDGRYDPGAGDRYFDANGDGEYSGPDGARQEDVVAWTSFKILWTGPPHEGPDTTRLEVDRSDTGIARGRDKRFTLYLLDRNMNPVAALPSGYDVAQVVVETPGYYEISPDVPEFLLDSERGFELAQDGTILGGLFEPRAYTFLIENTTPEGDDYESADYTVATTVMASPGYTLPGDSEYFEELMQQIDTLAPVYGTLQ